MSLCLSHETRCFPKLSTEQTKKAFSPCNTVTLLDVLDASKEGLLSIEGISKVLLGPYKTWLRSF